MDLTDDEIVASFGCSYNPDLDPEVYLKQPSTDEPIRRLFCALVADAVEVLRAPVPDGAGERVTAQKVRIRETKRWFASADEEYIFSFRFICRELGLDPWYILQGVKKLGKRTKRKNQYTERKKRMAA